MPTYAPYNSYGLQNSHYQSPYKSYADATRFNMTYLSPYQQPSPNLGATTTHLAPGTNNPTHDQQQGWANNSQYSAVPEIVSNHLNYAGQINTPLT